MRTKKQEELVNTCRHSGTRCLYAGKKCRFTGFRFDLSDPIVREMAMKWIEMEVNV